MCKKMTLRTNLCLAAVFWALLAVSSQAATIGAGSDITATTLDTAGPRLNIEKEYSRVLPSGTYDVSEFVFNASAGSGGGFMHPFVAKQTSSSPLTYETVWVGQPVPVTVDGVDRVNFASGAETFTLSQRTEVFGGVYHDGTAKLYCVLNIGTTDHDNSSPTEPTGAGQTLSNFSHGNLNRTYAFEINVLVPYVSQPDPEDGAFLESTWVNLSWSPGDFAVTHDVYLGDNFDDVNDGTGDTFRGNQTATTFIAGFAGFPYPEGLVPGTTYYWRIDEVNEADPNSPWKGDVWSFSIPPKTAYHPIPADGSKFVDPEPTLEWTAGFGAKLHTVYFGNDLDTVTNATGGAPQSDTTFTPGALELEKTYYWRVDEFEAPLTHKGDVWSFEVAKEGGGLKGEYYHWGGSFPPGQPFQNFVLSRVDPQINWNWGSGDVPGTNSPHESVNVNDFACRWTGEVEAVFTETYTFYTTTDDGARLWVDGKEIIKNAWRQQGMTEYPGTIDLVAGEKYFIEMWMYEHEGGAGAELRWSSPRTSKQIIPSAALSLPVRANNPFPTNGTVGVNLMSTLTWKPGDFAASHEVYFGTDRDAVANGTKASPEYKGSKQLGEESFDPGKLAWDTAYYWRIDEVNNTNPDSPWVGKVWSFDTGPFLVVDDFESYDDIDPAPGEPGINRIFDKWIDGYGTTTNGALVGNDLPPYAEQTIVHGGDQSMPYLYDNNLKTSEATLTLVYPRDWTEEGVTKLSLWFRGSSNNAADRIFIALNGTAVVYHDDPAATQLSGWKKWVIDLAAFGVDLTNVNSITIGIGTKNTPAAGGTGTMYFDDIRLIE